MLTNPQIISSIIGLAIGIMIVWLVRRDHLVSKDGARWLLLAVLIVLYSFFPKVNDAIGLALGISYPPIIPVLLGFGVVLIKMLLSDIERARMRVDIERLVQRMALLERELEDERSKDQD